MFETGYVTVARWKGTPIRVHWTTPIGMLMFGGLRFAPGIWLGYLLIVCLHEMGHAWLSRRMGLEAMSIDIHAFGGLCRYGGSSISAWQRSVVAWGGVLAQAIILAIACVAIVVLPAPPIPFAADLLGALTWTNLVLIGLNLLPFPPLDGAEAWRIIGLARDRRKRAAMRNARSHVEARVPARDALEIGEVDEAAVRETVRRALADAARSTKRGERQ
jgi:hypothetical protein